MSSGNPGSKRVSPGFTESKSMWDFHVAHSMAAEQAPEVKKATVGMWNLAKTSVDQPIMVSRMAQTGLGPGRVEMRF